MDSSEIDTSFSGELTLGTARKDAEFLKSRIADSKTFEPDFSSIARIDLSGIQILISARKTLDAKQTESGTIKIGTCVADAMKRCGYEYSAGFKTTED